MSETASCPCCGSPSGGATEPDGGREPAGAREAGATASGIEPLYREVRRIREIAEARASDDDARRIAELTCQVAEFRATVARLRGAGAPGLVAAGDQA